MRLGREAPMWIVAGLLLGAVLLAALAGFHTGPHAHVGAAVVGLVAAGWLAFMAVGSRSASAAWVLFCADLVVAGGIGVMGWTGLVHRHAPGPRYGRLEGAEGVAVSDLSPEGVVRVNGEQWSAVSANGTALAGSRVQVIRAGGVRLEVWAERYGTELWGEQGERRST